MSDTTLTGAIPLGQEADIEASTMRRVTWRFMPLLIVCYIFAYIDRVNTGFAALTANRDLGLSPVAYGWGAGLFFVGYFLFEYPSNIVLERVGARLWIARIMFTMGVIAAAMAFVTGPMSFYTVRFVLGCAEAGLFPGVILFMTFWFPQRYRGRFVAWFMLGTPVSSFIGAPLSGLLLQMHGLFGLKGWQWIYLMEALPSILCAFAAWWLLSDNPAKADWLEPAQRTWLQGTLDRENANHKHSHARMGYFASMFNPRVLVYAILFFNVTAPSYVLGLWLPQIVKNFGVTDMQTGLITAIPFFFGILAMLYWGRHSDQHGERIWHIALSALVMAVGLAACILTPSPVLQMIFISIAACGIYAVKGPWLSLLSSGFSGPGAAGGIAMATAIGNLSGFLPPYAIGWIKAETGSFSLGLLACAALPAIAFVHVLVGKSFRGNADTLA